MRADYGKGTATRILQLLCSMGEVSESKSYVMTFVHLCQSSMYVSSEPSIRKRSGSLMASRHVSRRLDARKQTRDMSIKSLAILEARTCRHAAFLQSSIRDPHSTLLSSSRACSSAFSLLHASIFRAHNNTSLQLALMVSQAKCLKDRSALREQPNY